MNSLTETSHSINLGPSWLKHLRPVLEGPTMRGLSDFLREEIRSGKRIYPEPKNFFAALNHTPLDAVKAVIIGQDPYHGVGQAHGMAFSVRHGVKSPPSLKNIHKELNADLGHKIPQHGNLEAWANAGVLLLNTSLSVEEKKPASHSNLGWGEFTDAVIKTVNAERDHVAFILWGAHAQSKLPLIDRNRHLVIVNSHPSPYSADRGFFGSKPFSRTNEWLIAQGKAPVDWRIL